MLCYCCILHIDSCQWCIRSMPYTSPHVLPAPHMFISRANSIDYISLPSSNICGWIAGTRNLHIFIVFFSLSFIRWFEAQDYTGALLRWTRWYRCSGVDPGWLGWWLAIDCRFRCMLDGRQWRIRGWICTLRCERPCLVRLVCYIPVCMCSGAN